MPVRFEGLKEAVRDHFTCYKAFGEAGLAAADAADATVAPAAAG
jgi:hypothetical protein